MVSRSLIMAESSAVSRFRVPKSGEEESKLLKESVPKSITSDLDMRFYQVSRFMHVTQFFPLFGR